MGNKRAIKFMCILGCSFFIMNLFYIQSSYMYHRGNELWIAYTISYDHILLCFFLFFFMLRLSWGFDDSFFGIVPEAGFPKFLAFYLHTGQRHGWSYFRSLREEAKRASCWGIRRHEDCDDLVAAFWSPVSTILAGV